MAPTNPRINTKLKSSSETSFPGLTSGLSNEAKTSYEEIQDDELLALASIYGEDFQRIEAKSGAWKVRTSFNLPNEHMSLSRSRKRSHRSLFVLSRQMRNSQLCYM